MIRGLYTAASGMIVKQVQQENLSNNIANINTAGYKKDNVVLKSFDEVLLQTRDNKVGRSNFKRIIGSMEFGVGIDDTKTYFSQGQIEETERNLDFAISGNGFFTILNSNGEERYTRDGRFLIDQNGYLTTMEGDRVIGVDSLGNKQPIRITGDEVQLSNGGIIENSQGKLKIYLSGFNDERDLVKEGANYYKANNPSIGEADGNIIQNSLERSNVDTLEAITEMISIMRSYESNQKVLQQMDETLGKTVNEVGRVR